MTDEKKRRPKPAKTQKSAKQIKILALITAPQSSGGIDIEKETERIIDTFTPLDAKQVFLSFPDPIIDTLTFIKERLQSKVYDILLLGVHTFKNQKGKTVLVLSGEDGSPMEIESKKFAQEIITLYHPSPIPLLILWPPQDAHNESNPMETAKSFHKSGISTLTFKKPLSPEAAIDVTPAFLEAILSKKDINQAVAEGIQAINLGEAKRLQSNPHWRPLKEAENVQLLLSGIPRSLADFSPFSLSHQWPQSHIDTPVVPELHIVGRQQILRQIYREIGQGESVIYLKGPAGVGKSTLLTHMVHHLLEKKYKLITFRGKLSAELFLRQIALIASEKGFKEAETIFEAPKEYKEKLEKLLEGFIYKSKPLLVFEDFHENQDSEGEWVNPRLKELLVYLKEQFKEKNGVMLFASEYILPKFPHLDVEPLTWPEFLKLINHTTKLRLLGKKSLQQLYFEIGGYPRAILWLDLMALNIFPKENTGFEWQQLRNHIPNLSERIMHKESETADLSYLLVEPLFKLLSPKQQTILTTLSLYKGWVSEDTLAAHQVVIDRHDRRSLEDIGFLQGMKQKKQWSYILPRLVAQTVYFRFPEKERQQLHLKAGQYFETLSPPADITQKDFSPEQFTAVGIDRACFERNLLEARHHYLEANQLQKVMNITSALDQYFTGIGFPQYAYDLLMEIEKFSDDFEEKSRLWLFNRLGIFCALFGKLDEGIKYHEAALTIHRSLGDSQGMTFNQSQIAMLYEAKGKYREALRYYEESLPGIEALKDKGILALRREKMGLLYKMEGDYEKSKEQYHLALKLNQEQHKQKEISVNLEQLGRLFDEQAKFDEALDYYRQSLAIKEKIDDKAGLAGLIHQMGNVYFFRGNLDTALEQYQRALALNLELDNAKGAGYSQGQIGLIMQRQGNIDEALQHFEESLKHFEKAEESKGIAAGHHQIGRILESRGDIENALSHYEKALEFREKNNDMLGAAITYGQLGMLYLQKEEYEKALRYSTQAYAIFTRFGSPNADLARNNMLRLRPHLTKETFEAILTEYNIKIEPGPPPKS